MTEKAEYEAQVAELLRRIDEGIDEATAAAVQLSSLKGKVLFGLSKVRQAEADLAAEKVNLQDINDELGAAQAALQVIDPGTGGS